MKMAASRYGTCFEKLSSIPLRDQGAKKMPAATWGGMGWWGHAMAYRIRRGPWPLACRSRALFLWYNVTSKLVPRPLPYPSPAPQAAQLQKVWRQSSPQNGLPKHDQIFIDLFY